MVSALVLDSTMTRDLGTGLGFGWDRRGDRSARRPYSRDATQLRQCRTATGPRIEDPPLDLSRWSWRHHRRIDPEQLIRVIRDDRADPDHLRRVRAADRLLPPRRLAPLHRRPPRVARASLNLAVVLVGCFLAAVIGDQVGYAFGKKVGPSIFQRPNSRLFKQEHVERADEFFEEHGAKTILLARFVPVVRTFVADPRRRRQDAVPDVPRLQHHRRVALGRRRDDARLLARRRRSAPTTSTSTCCRSSRVDHLPLAAPAVDRVLRKHKQGAGAHRRRRPRPRPERLHDVVDE